MKKVLKEQGQEAWMIENCGMEEEKNLSQCRRNAGEGDVLYDIAGERGN